MADLLLSPPPSVFLLTPPKPQSPIPDKGPELGARTMSHQEHPQLPKAVFLVASSVAGMLPSVFTVSNFECADMENSDHRVHTNQHRGENPGRKAQRPLSSLVCPSTVHLWGHRLVEIGMDGREGKRLTSSCFFLPSQPHPSVSILGADAGSAAEEGAGPLCWQEGGPGQAATFPAASGKPPSPIFNLQKFFILLMCYCSFFFFFPLAAKKVL